METLLGHEFDNESPPQVTKSLTSYQFIPSAPQEEDLIATNCNPADQGAESDDLFGYLTFYPTVSEAPAYNPYEAPSLPEAPQVLPQSRNQSNLYPKLPLRPIFVDTYSLTQPQRQYPQYSKPPQLSQEEIDKIMFDESLLHGQSPPEYTSLQDSGAEYIFQSISGRTLAPSTIYAPTVHRQHPKTTTTTTTTTHVNHSVLDFYASPPHDNGTSTTTITSKQQESQQLPQHQHQHQHHQQYQQQQQQQSQNHQQQFQHHQQQHVPLYTARQPTSHLSISQLLSTPSDELNTFQLLLKRQIEQEHGIGVDKTTRHEQQAPHLHTPFLPQDLQEDGWELIYMSEFDPYRQTSYQQQINNSYEQFQRESQEQPTLWGLGTIWNYASSWYSNMYRGPTQNSSYGGYDNPFNTSTFEPTTTTTTTTQFVTQQALEWGKVVGLWVFRNSLIVGGYTAQATLAGAQYTFERFKDYYNEHYGANGDSGNNTSSQQPMSVPITPSQQRAIYEEQLQRQQTTNESQTEQSCSLQQQEQLGHENELANALPSSLLNSINPFSYRCISFSVSLPAHSPPSPQITDEQQIEQFVPEPVTQQAPSWWNGLHVGFKWQTISRPDSSSSRPTITASPDPE